MNHRRRLTSSAVIIAAIATFLLPGPVLAADAAEVESLRREVRQLHADIQLLRNAVAEATELERLRSANLAKQMKAIQQTAAESQPTPPPPVASAEAPSASRETNAVMAPAAADERPARGKHRRNNRHTSRGRSKASKVQAR